MTRIVLDIDDTRWKVDHLARIMRTAQSEWLSELAAQVDIQVTDARPLIVLDLGKFVNDDRDIAKILRHTAELHRNGRTGGYNVTSPRILELIADQIEAQTKPARIPEPYPLGSLYRASQVGECDGSKRVWVRFSHAQTDCWIDWLGHIRSWSDLSDPEPYPFGGKS